MVLRCFVFSAAVVSLLGAAGVANAQAPPHTRGTPEPRPLIIRSTGGEDMFKFYCASCHGIDAKGRKPISASHPVPPDLTRLAAAAGGVFPRGRVLESVASGQGAPTHRTGNMPRWGWIFRSLDPSREVVEVRIANLVQYIESIQVR